MYIFWCTLEYNICSFAWSKERKIKAGESYELRVMIYEWNLFVVNLKWFTLKWNFCSFPWWKEPKIKASGLLLKRSCRYLLKIFAPKRFILFAPENADFVGDLLRSFRQKSSFSVQAQNPIIPRPNKLLWIEIIMIYELPKLNIAFKYDWVNFERMQRTTNWLFELPTSEEVSFNL